ncbi:MAG TPA: T9SS type A sorting domain-containing protein [Flavobacteriales bacterium]|nr:T9SS type A sorting domain-containing protein [Flavobacteriales bacterium]
MSYLYSSGGTQAANLIISQIAGCVDTFMMTPVVNTFPVLSLSSIGVYCDSSNGTATVVASSGTAPYTYTWSSGSTTTEATNLDLGLYTIAVTDVNNCTTLDTITINESFQAAISEISPSTCGNADGIATVSSVSGGFPPYAYAWSSGDTTVTDSGLTSGVQYVTVIDVNGCVAYATIEITDSDTGPSIGLIAQTNNLCAGEENGAIGILVVGGVAPYDIIWSNGEVTQSIDSLGEGIYELTVTDAQGCVAAASYTVTSPYPLASTSVVSDATCGISDGSAVIVVNGGTLPYTYSWQGGGTDQIKSGLTAGIYSVTVTDNNGCTLVTPIIVNNVGGPSVQLLATTSTDCNNLTAGAIDITASGGTPAYTYLWSNADTSEDISGLTVGQYTVTVTDAATCVAALVVEIEDLVPAIQDICVVTVDTVSGKNIVVWEKTGGLGIDHFNIYKEGTQSGIYQLIGSTPFGSLSEYHDSLSDPSLRSWRYKISAVDSCGQESALSSIHKTLHLTINLALGGGNNLIWDGYSGLPISTYVIYRGTAPDTLKAINIVSGNSFTFTDPSPPAGTLHYVVAALHPFGGCTADKAKNYNSSKSNSTSVGLAPTPSLAISTSTTNATTGNCDGTATASVTGGAAPYTYSWNTSPVQTDSVAIGLCPGTYTASIIDSNGDTISADVTVVEGTNSLQITMSATSATFSICDGTATASVTGGTAPYTYSWNTSPTQTNATATGLCPGTYTATVIDNNSDMITDFVLVDENVSVEDIDLNALIGVYPNPNRGTFLLHVDQRIESDIEISIYSIKGELIYEEFLNSNSTGLNHFIDIAKNSAGIYYLRMTMENAVVHKKVVIE